MPSINVPQRQVRSAGSTGVKADIDINSSAFRAISGFGAAISGAVGDVGDARQRVAEEGQRVVDSGIAANYTREKSVFGKGIQTSMMSGDLIGNYEGQLKSFNTQVAERERAISEQLKQASPDQQKRILDAWEDDKANLKAQFDANRQREAIGNVIAQHEGAIEELTLNGDIAGAETVIDSMPITDAQKTERKTVLKRAVRAIQESDITVTIAEAQDIPSLDFSRSLIDNSDLGTIKKNALKRKAETRERSIKSAIFSAEGDYYSLVRNSTHDILTGQIPDEQTLLNRGMNEADVKAMSSVVQGMSGSSGIASPEADKLSADIKSFSNDVWWKFDDSASDRVGLKNELANPKWNFDARLQFAAEMARAFKADAADGQIGTALGDVNLDDNQIRVVEEMQGQIFEKIRNRQGQPFRATDIDKITFVNSMIDPDQASLLFDKFADATFLEQFKGLSKEDSDELYAKVVTPLFTKAVNLSIQQRIKERVKALEPIK